MLSLYDTLVLPYLNHCNIVWANNKTTRLQPLVVLQKRAMRLITTSAHNAHTIPLFSKLNRLTLVDMNKLLIATFMFRSHTKSLPNIFSGYFAPMPPFMVIPLVIQVNCTFLMLARMLEGFRYEYMDRSSGIRLIQQSLINQLIGVLSNIGTRSICYHNTNSLE